MAIAAFALKKVTGTGPTLTNTNKHPTFLGSDIHSENASGFPIGIPPTAAQSPAYSFECVLQWECSVAPDNSVSDIRLYGPNTQPDASTNKLKIFWDTATSYTVPTNIKSVIAITSQHNNYFSNDPGDFLSLGVEPGDNIINAVGERTIYLYSQLEIAFEAASGAMPTQSFTMRWTEA